MLSRTLRTLAATAIIAFATVAVAQEMGPAGTYDTARGTILTGPNGLTLYTFDNDTPGVSNCYGNCAVNWPPFYVGDNAAMADADWTIVQRTDDAPMWAYKGQPLYYWRNDTRAGDMTGDGVGGVWHIVVTEVPM
jgi:predicted lipoprotein with Yx(FWY)xxD motif